MPPRYLASHDGSEQAAGRGSGLHTTQITAESFSKAPQVSTDSRDYPHPQAQPRATGDVNHALAAHLHKMTPYMQMTFAPLERRIDTAIFRALFASSVRQARQFVIHGAVKVNGKKVSLPYQSIFAPNKAWKKNVLTIYRWFTHPICLTLETCSRSI